MGLTFPKRKPFILGALLLIFSGCSGSKPDSIGITNNSLAECPDKPNCVSSVSQNEKHFILPFQLAGHTDDGWTAVIDTIREIPRNTIVTQTDRYLHVEIKSRIFRFVDDLELLLNPESGQVDIRSASRIGYSDLGVNRKRVESLRKALLKNGTIRNQPAEH